MIQDNSDIAMSYFTNEYQDQMLQYHISKLSASEKEQFNELDWWMNYMDQYVLILDKQVNT